ncbi:TPA: MFS transporter [Streptococcus suis]|uniref:MFS transporter n=1 Tax=Streptococcus parasuis TaxID=1501662 RepID=UPI002899B8B2|nr:MFS transporter [Streptococcus parasuis]
MKKHFSFILLGIMMLGVVMRAPFTALPAVLTDIASGLGVEVSSLGILTSIPLIMFALCSSIAPRMAAKFGLERLMAIVLVIMVIGSGLRVFNLQTLFIGTMMIGASIAFINVLLPSLVAANFPHKIGLYTTIYITLMGISGTVASMVAVPIVSATSWKFFIYLITGVILLALLIWLPNVKNNHMFVTGNQSEKTSSLWKNKAAIAFLIFGGLQSVLFYTEVTWLPTISQSIGFSKAEAGLMSGIYNLAAIPMSSIITTLLSRQTKESRRNIMLLISLITLVGLALMVITPKNFLAWTIIHIVLSVSNASLFPYMMLSFTMKTSNSQATARLSGMVQTGGYLIAAFGPVLLGYSFPIFGSWLPLILSLATVTLVMMWTIVLIEKEDIII